MNKIVIPVLILLLAVRFFTLDKADLRDGQSLKFVSRLTGEPSIRGQRASFQLFYKGNRINITTSSANGYSYGEILSIDGKVKMRLLNNKNQIISMNFPKIEADKDSLALIYSIRQYIISIFEKSLPANYSSLLLGIVFGIKSSFSSDFLNNLKLLGLMHVIAASGMNVTLTAGFLSSIFLLFFKRQTALILTIFGIVLYAFLAGFQASIVRASIMGIIVFTAQILGRQRLASYSLMLTAYIMILFSPYVIWDIGFQLSFLSTAGLIFIRPILKDLSFLKKLLKFLIVGEDISTTIAAQAATLPILLANFGLYSVFSVPINALVLWTIPFIMIIGGLGFIFSFVFEPLGKLIMYLSVPLLFYFESVVNLFSRFSGAITASQISWPFVLGYYSLLLGAIFAAYGRRHE